jgi:hypothetical protein
MTPTVADDLRLAWRGLPMLLGAAAPVLVVVGAMMGVAATGAWALVAALGGLGLGCALQACCDVAVAVRAGDVLGPRALARATARGIARGAAVGAAVAAPALLAVAAVEAQEMPAVPRLAALFADLAVLGGAVLGAPFAAAAQALGADGPRRAWHAGLAIVACAPRAALAVLPVLAVAPALVALLGPVPIWAAAGPLALVAVGVAARVVDGLPEVDVARHG